MLRFDEFELNIQSGELRKHGKVLRLQPQPAKVLSVLALQSGKLVTREKLEMRPQTPKSQIPEMEPTVIPFLGQGGTQG